MGDVNEPGIYELKDEMNVAAALKGASGLSSIAETERILLERIENHSERTAEQFALDAAGQRRELKDGDVLRIFPVSPEFKKSVMLRGNVAQLGRFAWRDGMRVSDLITNRESLVTRDFWNRQNHRVKEPRDRRLVVAPQGELASMQAQVVDLARDNAGNTTTDNPEINRIKEVPDQPFADWPQVETATSQVRADDIARDNAEINWDYAVIERLDAQAKAMMESLADLRAQVAAKEVELQALRSWSTERNPDVQLAEHELSSMQGEVSRMEQRGHSSGLSDLGLGEVSSAGLDYLRADHGARYRQAMVDLLMKQYDAAKLDESKEVTIIQEVELAIQAHRRSFPKLLPILLVALTEGVFVGCFVALLPLWLQFVHSDNPRSRQLQELKSAMAERMVKGL